MHCILHPASYTRTHYPHAQPQPNGTQRCLQTHTDKHDAGNAEATWELWRLYLEGGDVSASALAHITHESAAGKTTKCCFRASSFEADLHTNKTLSTWNRILLYLEGGDETCVSTQPGAAGQTFKCWPLTKEFWGHNCSQFKHYYLFWNHRSKLKLWRVYLEGGDIRALAHTRAPQARSEKMVPLSSKFWRQICIQRLHPALEIAANCTLRVVIKRPWAHKFAPQVKP